MRNNSRAFSVLAWLPCAFAAVSVAQPQTTYTVLHDFALERQPKGITPFAGVVRDSAGNLYGAADRGGLWNKGTVFQLNPAGQLTVLYSFTGKADGGGPVGGVIRDAAGNLYGTTEFDGDFSSEICGADPSQGCGVVYKVDPSGHQTVLHAFAGLPDGAYPTSGLVLDPAGNLYGTTSYGGASVAGTVFKLNPAGQFTLLYTFTGGADGNTPSGPLVLDASGNLYGTTKFGGRACTDSPLGLGCGVVFKIDPAGNETVLFSFAAGDVGKMPTGGVIRDAQGNLYGTASAGGKAGMGVVFMLDPAGHEKIIHSFTGGADGSEPQAALYRDSAGNLYGTTVTGGAGNRGTAFKLDPSGQETILNSFTGPNGQNPQSSLVSDPAGDLYGTTTEGGSHGQGVVYMLDPAGQETVLYVFFAGAIDGTQPAAPLVRDAAGNFYGTTPTGGQTAGCDSSLPPGCGTVYKIDPAGQEALLYAFKFGNDGAEPSTGLTLDSAGNLYGTTPLGGSTGGGVLYKLDPAGHESLLHTFGAANGSREDGSRPMSGVTFDAAGNLYGTTNLGGAEDQGTIYKVDPSGNESILYSFVSNGYPTTGVVLDPAGNIYGTSSVVYKLDTTGNYTVLYEFTGGADGQAPNGLVRDPAGNLYGTTASGGACPQPRGCGVIFKLDTAGNYSVLYTFAGGADGRSPLGTLVLDAAGNLYGTTLSGGTANLGTIFRLDADDNYTVLYSLPNPLHGRGPKAAVVLDPAGNLYGTAYQGGTQNGGVVFKLSPQ